jgi:hypothetical protein
MSDPLDKARADLMDRGQQLFGWSTMQAFQVTAELDRYIRAVVRDERERNESEAAATRAAPCW